MGAGFHGGFGNTDGTKSKETNKLSKELESNGIKFSKEDREALATAEKLNRVPASI